MIAHKIPINKDTAYLLEVLKVESYYDEHKFSLTLQNKDLSFLNKIEKIVIGLDMNISKRFLFKIRLPNETKKESVKIFNREKELNFHIEKSPFDNKRVKAVTNLPYKKEYIINILINNKLHKIKINITKYNIICLGDIDCWAYLDFRFPNKRIFAFLKEFGGNKNKFSKYLIGSDLLLIMSAFSGLIDAEGSINWYGLKRIIRIRMRNKEYLKDWCILLNKIGVGCKFRKNTNKEYEINISGWEDFNRLKEFGLTLYHSKRAETLEKIIKGFKRHQISRGNYKVFYINRLKELNKKVTSEEFSGILNKGKRVVSHYLLKLNKEKLIECDKSKEPYLYFIST